MSTSVYVPYNLIDSLWGNYLQVVNFLGSYLSPGNTVSTSTLTASRDTLKNGLDYINGNLLYLSLQTELANLQQGVALPVTISSSIVGMAETRITTMNTTVSNLATLLRPQMAPVINFSDILNGITGFPETGMLDYIMTYLVEPVPAGLGNGNMSVVLANQSTDWYAYAAALAQAFPSGEGDAIEAFNRQAAVAQSLSTIVGNIEPFSQSVGLLQLWNQIATYPSLVAIGALQSTNPNNALLQSLNTLKYVINTTLIQMDTLIASFNEQNLGTVHVITVRQNDSLPNIADRHLGNFEQWQQIAQLNGINPPYQVYPGQQLFLPPATNNNQQTPPNYLINYLGTDLYYGPLNSNMLPWTGDFFTISGYENLAFALERRILTTLGTLIYHPNYGSRVPPEVGNIQEPQTATHIGAYANSAILTDPRVNNIPYWTVSMQPNNLISYQATIQPNGFNTASTNLNLVLQP